MNAPTHPMIGLHYDLAIEQYHGSGVGISKSGLDDIERSPLHYYASHLDPDRPKEEERKGRGLDGSLFHCALFEPDEFEKRYVIIPADAPGRPTEAMLNAAKPSESSIARIKWWADFDAANNGRTVISADQGTMAWRMADSARKLPEIRTALSRGKSEVSAYWKDERTGELCRCRPDFVADVGGGQVILIDGKSYSDASPADFARQIARMRYDVQASLYTDGYQIAANVEVIGFVFVAVELKWPHAACPIAIDDDGMESGRRKYRRNLDTYAHCRRTGEWPGFPQTVQVVSLPRWAQEND